MANITERSSSQTGAGNGIKGFFLGILFTLLLQILGGGLYFFTRQAQPTASSTTPSTNTAIANPTTPSTVTPVAPETTSTTPTNAPISTTSDAGQLPQAASLNLQANHANGSSLRVTGVSFAEGSIVLTMSITNGYSVPIQLENAQQDTFLKDNLGNIYYLSPPVDNPKIKIEPNTTIKGQFVFSGRIAPTAASLTLSTNSRFGGDQNFASAPTFTIPAIPVNW